MTAAKWYESRLAVILEGVLIGAAAGGAVVFFRYVLSRGEDFRRSFYQALPGFPPSRILLWIGGLAAAGLFMGWAVKARPMIRGSGIPQVKGALLGRLSLDWGPELPLKLLTGILALGAGLSLGREGPSIQIGAYVGLGVLTLFRRPGRERKYLVAAASSAGLAAAFNAPLAGLLFALEELQPGFSPLFIACAMGSAMAANTVAGFAFGFKPVFNFNPVPALPLENLPWVLVLGLICGLLGALFKASLYGSLGLYDRLRIPPVLRPLIPLLASVPAGLFLFDITGGGHGLIESLSQTERALGLIVLLFAGKLLFTALCYGSGAPGGIFLPLLTCGALAGSALGMTLSGAGLVDGGRLLNFIILGMAGFFAATVQAPVTGIVLILEMSGDFNHLSSLVLVSFSAFVTVEILGSRPVYAVLLKRILANQKPKTARAAPQAGDK
jgi:H+/Cl- antiporter ClcA